MQQHKVLPVCIWGCKGLMVPVLIPCAVPVLLCPCLQSIPCSLHEAALQHSSVLGPEQG